MKIKNSGNLFSKNRMASIILLIGLSYVLWLSNCTQPALFIPTSTPGIFSPVSYTGGGVAIGIREFQDSPSWRTYKVAPSSHFTAFLRLLNQKGAETYLFTCLIDYKQAPCTFEDKEAVLLYSIDMAENEDKLIKFETPQLSNGFHDFSILVFANPEQHNLDDKYRLSTDLNYFYAARAVLLVGEPPYSSPALDFDVGEARNYSKSQLNGVVINTVPDSKIIPGWFSQNVKQDEILDYYIHLANDTGPEQTYVVMSFLDFRQIPVSKSQENRYVLLKTGERIEIPAQIRTPSENGVHELMVILAPRPFQLIEIIGEDSKRELTKGNFHLENSIRVGIVVQGQEK